MSFTQLLQSLNLKCVNTSANGNCMFNSFSIVKYNHAKQHHIIRQKAVKYIKTHPQEFRQIVEDWKSDGIHSIGDYCSFMKENGSWGDEHMLKAICQVYKCRIKVFVVTHLDDLCTITYGNLQYSDLYNMHFCCRTEHYSALVQQRVGDSQNSKQHKKRKRHDDSTQECSVVPLRRSLRLKRSKAKV